jgi:hypothetical protein
MTCHSSRTTAAQHPRYAAQIAFTRIALVTIGVLAVLLATARAAGAQDVRLASALVPIQDEAPAKLTVDAPIPDALAVGAVFIQYRTENLRAVRSGGGREREMVSSATAPCSVSYDNCFDWAASSGHR